MAACYAIQLQRLAWFDPILPLQWLIGILKAQQYHVSLWKQAANLDMVPEDRQVTATDA